MPTSPTGTVTFLFTDIEGSTWHWNQQPEAMKIALARHDTILRSSIEAHDGHVFKTVGDGFYSAFPVASDALAAALEAQRALAAEPWGEIGGLRVRMALHTGTVHERELDYFGPTLNRVARLLSAGHGGQTLLSLATEQLLRDHLPEGAHLRDLGTHRLRDLIRPEQIFEVVAPLLPSDFPALKTLDGRPNNLQMQPTTLLGREHEVEQVCARLRREDVRLLTLTGPGGTGKTRLGLQIAADLLDDYKDGVFFVALAPLSDPALVISTIAQTLGVQETGGRSALQCLQDYLREKSLLLALDNFEQITEAAPQVAELLANAPRLNILVTSRVPLHLRGEHEFAVPPLALPDCRHLPALETLSQYASVELFIERARAVKPDFAVNHDNARAVAEICVRLDGLPLAIELAAARVKFLSPRTMLVRLKEPLKLLTGGARDLTARQQTLRGAIAWSHDLLDENEKRLFRRLAVFVGGCTLEAAEAVCRAGGDLGVDVFDGIASLIDKSLLRPDETPDGESRFFMLETIHEYALERLTESGEKDELHDRHAEFFLSFAEHAEIELRGFQQLKWLDRLEVEHDNLRAVLGWLTHRDDAQRGLRMAGAMEHFWNIRGHFSEAEKQFGVLLALRDAAQPTAARAKALCAAAWFSSFQERRKAHAWLEESVQLWRELGDKRWLVLATMSLGQSHRLCGDPAKGLALVEQSVALAREPGDKWCLAIALLDLGRTAIDRGEVIAAREALEESIQLCRELGDRYLMAYALLALGDVMSAQGEPEKQRALQEECLVIHQELKNGLGIANSLTRLGHLAFDTGDYSAATVSFKASLETRRQLGFKPGMARSLSDLGLVAYYQGRYEEASRMLDEALTHIQTRGNMPGIAHSLLECATVKYAQGDLDQARTWSEQGLALFRSAAMIKNVAWASQRLARVACAQGDLPAACAALIESLGIFRQMRDRRGIAEGLAGFARVAHAQCDSQRAARLFGAAESLHKIVGPRLNPLDHHDLASVVAMLRSALGDETFTTAWADGRALTTDQAIAYALEEPERSSP